MLQDLIPCCKEIYLSKSDASGHVSLCSGQECILGGQEGFPVQCENWMEKWSREEWLAGKGREQSIQQPECLRSSLWQRSAVSQTMFI